MVVHKCDRCKEEIRVGMFGYTKINFGMFLPKEYEVCDKCLKEIEDFIQGQEEKERSK